MSAPAIARRTRAAAADQVPKEGSIDRALMWLWRERHEIRRFAIFFAIMWPLLWTLMKMGEGE